MISPGGIVIKCVKCLLITVSVTIRCGGIFNDRFMANFLESMSVKEFTKLVNI